MYYRYMTCRYSLPHKDEALKQGEKNEWRKRPGWIDLLECNGGCKLRECAIWAAHAVLSRETRHRRRRCCWVWQQHAKHEIHNKNGYTTLSAYLSHTKPIMSGLMKMLDPVITKAAQLYRAQLAKDLNKMGT